MALHSLGKELHSVKNSHALPVVLTVTASAVEEFDGIINSAWLRTVCGVKFAPGQHTFEVAANAVLLLIAAIPVASYAYNGEELWITVE